MYAEQLYLGLAILTVAVTAQANAISGNPLHPSYYWSVAVDVQAKTSGAKPYVDSRNPLHPTYARVTVDWQPAVALISAGYRDSKNPLHPSFTR